MMKRIVGLISMALMLSACTQKSAYETAVENMAPFYCYKSLAGVVIIGWPGFPQRIKSAPASIYSKSTINHPWASLTPAKQRIKRPFSLLSRATPWGGVAQLVRAAES